MHKQLETRRSLGLFGGTFDPIHFGHLRAALEIYQNLNLDEMRIIPCKQPPHRPVPKATPFDRIEMIRNAVINTPLILDDREMHRDGPSYTVDTLMSFRREFPRASLCLLVGVDTFLGLTSWHQWEKIIQLANIIVMHRHGWTVPDTGIIAELLHTYALEHDESITDFSCGRIITQSITPLDISATKIRTLLKAGQSPQFLCPDPVLKYIETHRLYGHTTYNNGYSDANGLPPDLSAVALAKADYHNGNGNNSYNIVNGYSNGLPADLSARVLAQAEASVKTGYSNGNRYTNSNGYNNGNGLPANMPAGMSAGALAKAEAPAKAGYSNGINTSPEVTHI